MRQRADIATVFRKVLLTNSSEKFLPMTRLPNGDVPNGDSPLLRDPTGTVHYWTQRGQFTIGPNGDGPNGETQRGQSTIVIFANC